MANVYSLDNGRGAGGLGVLMLWQQSRSELDRAITSKLIIVLIIECHSVVQTLVKQPAQSEEKRGEEKRREEKRGEEKRRDEKRRDEKRREEFEQIFKHVCVL